MREELWQKGRGSFLLYRKLRIFLAFPCYKKYNKNVCYA